MIDTFDPWSADDPMPPTWTLVGGDAGLARIVADGDARGLRVATTGDAGSVRACRGFAPLADRPVTVVLRVRTPTRPPTDAPLLMVRGPGFGAVDVRFGATGVFSYVDGAEKVRTTVAYATATWYVAQTTVQPDGSFDLVIRSGTADGPIVIRRSGLSPRETPTGPLDRVCVETARGAAGLALDVDSLVVSVPRP